MPIKEEVRHEIIWELQGDGDGRYFSIPPLAVQHVKNALEMPNVRLSDIIRILEQYGADEMEIITLLFNAQENYYEQLPAMRLEPLYLNEEKGAKACIAPPTKRPMARTWDHSNKLPRT